jgi:hypothetical protein
MSQPSCQEAQPASKCGMHANHAGRCAICDAAVGERATFCLDCEKSFAPVAPDGTDFDGTPLDLEKYACQMFPWEPTTRHPALIESNGIWLILAVGLVLLVVLLALFRTPLPSCWEISS